MTTAMPERVDTPVAGPSRPRRSRTRREAKPVNPTEVARSTWRRLVEPAQEIRSAETRRRSRLLSALLMVLIPLTLAGVVFGYYAAPPQDELVLLFGGLVFVMLLFAA